MRRFAIVPTKAYKKDLKRLVKSGFDLSKLEHVIDLLARGETLPHRYHDHALRGALRNIHECHIAPDWLLSYTKDNDRLILLLIRTGSHRDVLGIE